VVTLLLTAILSGACNVDNFKHINTKRFEGIQLAAYEDTLGYRTIGYGHNMEKVGSKELFLRLGLSWKDLYTGKSYLTLAQAEKIYLADYAVAVKDAMIVFKSFKDQPEIIQRIMVDLSFNMGRTKLSKFYATIEALNNKDYKQAAKQLLNSRWYGQVGRRSKEIIAVLKNPCLEAYQSYRR
jgi:lysozyme